MWPVAGLLTKFVNGASKTDIRFVVGILRVYDGVREILEVCKAVIKALPERSELWGEVAACIESTGVVSGEYGFVDAYERKRAEMVTWQQDDDPRVRSFSQWIVASLEHMIEYERQRADESLAMRKYKHGEGTDEA